MFKIGHGAVTIPVFKIQVSPDQGSSPDLLHAWRTYSTYSRQENKIITIIRVAFLIFFLIHTFIKFLHISLYLIDGFPRNLRDPGFTMMYISKPHLPCFKNTGDHYLCVVHFTLHVTTTAPHLIIFLKFYENEMVAYVFASYMVADFCPLLYALWVMGLIYVELQHNKVEMQQTWSRSHVNIIILHVDIIYLCCMLT